MDFDTLGCQAIKKSLWKCCLPASISPAGIVLSIYVTAYLQLGSSKHPGHLSQALHQQKQHKLGPQSWH